MASILPGYQYDVFISYRQKDNQSDQWVTTFVQALKEELGAIFKEDVSVYFDANPHDGLHETHDVDGSLKEKVRCLVFVPIVSRTYCDPKSFAWSKEFLAFISFAREDGPGLKVVLPNGNVASRALAVRIHDLDKEDVSLFENVSEGVMRPVEFVYAETGVNRPLRPSDRKEDNINRTEYHNQVNKTAIAISEIISAIKSPSKGYSPKKETPVRAPREKKEETSPPFYRKWWVLVSVLFALLPVVYFFQSTGESKVEAQGVVSIAVLPFVDMSPDKDQEYFSEGLSEEIRSALTKQTGLRVMGRTSSFSFKDTDTDVMTIGEELGVNTVLEGSVRKSGNTLRVTAQLTNTENGFQIWSQTYDKELTEIFEVQDEITGAILRELKVHLSGGPKQVADDIKTDLTAYELYMQARQKLALRGKNLLEAKKLFEKVIEIDPGYSLAYSGLGRTCSLLPAHLAQPTPEYADLVEDLGRKAIELNPENAEGFSVLGFALGMMKWDFKAAEPYFEKSYELNPTDSEIINFLGDFYSMIWDTRGLATEKLAFDLDPLHPIQSNDLANTNLMYGNYDEAEKYALISVGLDSFLLSAFDNYLDAKIAKGEYEKVLKDIENYPTRDRFTELKMNYKKVLALNGLHRMQEVEDLIKDLEEAVGAGEYFASYVAFLHYKLGNGEKASYFLKKAISNYDYYLVMGWEFTLPEDYSETPSFGETLNAPILQGLFELRRRSRQTANLKSGN